VFEGIRGSTYTGDISIDDISIKNGPCPAPGSCDFESGMCTWSNDHTGDDFDWLRNRGDTTSKLTGPVVDHTLGTKEGMHMSWYIL